MKHKRNATLGRPLYALLLFAYLIVMGVLTIFVIPAGISQRDPIPTASPTTSPTNTPTISGCECSANEQPLYNTFPHPAHTDDSYAVFNFYNDGAIDENNQNMTIWVSMYITADAPMAAADNRFEVAYTYVYVDAVPLARGQLYTYTMKRAVTGGGRAPGGRIVIYYRDPREHDELRRTVYNNAYPVQTPDKIEAIKNTNNAPAIPSDRYTQLLEFTLDVGNNKPFIDYDLSAVDTIALPVYIFGGYDTTTLPGALTGNVNNGFPCGKAYIGCQRTHETTDGCPTEIIERTPQGSICLSPLKYCSWARRTTYLNDPRITNKTNWLHVCSKFDEIAQNFGITQELLDTFYACGNPDLPRPPVCPPINPGDITTPSGVIYGCNGKFLLENQCLQDGSRFTFSRLDGSQCSALNRGLCVQPDYHPVPPQGLSCAEVLCPSPNPSCFMNCSEKECMNYDCGDYAIGGRTLCDDVCPFDTLNCRNVTSTKAKFKTTLCNDSSPFPYERGLIQNDYAAWARSKGERFYAFSLDEEVGGGNQQCLYSSQLDVVVFPRCNGNY